MEQSVERELSRFAELRRRILDADPDIDDTTLLDTLEGATNLAEAIAEVLRAALLDEALVDGLKPRMEDLSERLDRLETSVAAKRKVALQAMEEAGLEKIVEPDFTVSLRTTPGGVTVINEAEIPEWFWIPQPPKLDRKRLLDALRAGAHVAGVELANSRVSLTIRTK